jgi:hypothetical protein
MAEMTFQLYESQLTPKYKYYFYFIYFHLIDNIIVLLLSLLLTILSKF